MKYQHITLVFAAIVISLADAQWTPDPFCPYPSDHVTRYPYYGNCSVYWECYEGTKYIMECPEGLEFNAPLEQCDTPSIAKCDPFAPTTQNPNPPTWTTDPTATMWTPDPLCPYPSDEETFYPYPGDCTKYYECYQGNKYEYQCPDGLWWHDEIMQCDYPGDFCDGSTVSPPTSSSDGPTTDYIDPRCVDGGTSYWPHPINCNMYIECYEGKSYEMTCPSGLFYSEGKKKCVTEEESECCQSEGC